MATKPGANRNREGQRRPGGGEPPDAMALVHRRCAVCEWEGDGVEPVAVPAITPTCPWCHAPTERVTIDGISVAPDEETGGKNPHAAALGRLGGLKGGVARAAALTPKERRDIATKAARMRWKKKPDH